MLDPSTKNSFSKKERLKSQKKIEALFTNGQSDFSYPVKVIWKTEPLKTSLKQSIKATFTVSKKKIKSAVNRNLVKRRMREAYRQNNGAIKQVLFNQQLQMNLVFVFVNNQPLNYGEIAPKIILLLHRLQNLLPQNNPLNDVEKT